MSPAQSLLLATAVCLHLIVGPSKAFPLLLHPSPSLLSRRGNGTDEKATNVSNEKYSGIPPYILAIIVTFTIVGTLLLSAVCMVTVLWYRRRRIDNPSADETPPSETSREPEKRSPQCAWCYISDNKVCKWCAGEAEDEDASPDAWRDGLYVSPVELKHNGWRSVLNPPVQCRAKSPIRARSPAAYRNPVRGFGRLSLGGSIVAKRSFKPGGIYDVPTMPSPDYPGTAVMWEMGECKGEELPLER